MQVDVTPGGHKRLWFSILRYYPISLRDRLRREGVWDDLEQELQLAAWEAEKKNLGAHDTSLLAGRRIHAFLKTYGYRVYQHRYYRAESPLSLFADHPYAEEMMLTRDRPPPAFIGQDHLEESILSMLREHPEGLVKWKLYNRLGISAHELDWHCAPLIEQGLIHEVKRQNTSGRWPTPLLVAGPAPEGETWVDKRERIRHAYFQEGKGIKQIAREFHHSRRTVRKAIYATQLLR